MSEFRAPPPPPDLEWDSDTDETLDDGNIGHINQKMVAVAVGLVMIGLLLGFLIFSSKSEPVACHGLTNVIRNPDIKGALPICGNISETAPCVLYVLNHTRHDKKAQDFFQDAANLLSRNLYPVEIENTMYAKTRIPPAHFAEIKIPELR